MKLILPARSSKAFLKMVLVVLLALMYWFLLVNQLERQNRAIVSEIAGIRSDIAKIYREQQMGARFTYDDGVMLFHIVKEDGYSIYDVYGNKQTNFRRFIEKTMK